MDIRGDFSSIPLIDLKGLGNEAAERELAPRVGEICHHIGFALLTNHGVSSELTDEVFAKAKNFFELPLDQKLSIDKRKSRHFRGWEPEGAEHTNNRPDTREQIDLWTEHPARTRDVDPTYLRLLGPNQWPSDQLVPGFKASVQTWVEQTSVLASRIMRLLAISLQLQPSYFEELFGREGLSKIPSREKSTNRALALVCGTGRVQQCTEQRRVVNQLRCDPRPRRFGLLLSLPNSVAGRPSRTQTNERVQVCSLPLQVHGQMRLGLTVAARLLQESLDLESFSTCASG